MPFGSRGKTSPHLLGHELKITVVSERGVVGCVAAKLETCILVLALVQG